MTKFKDIYTESDEFLNLSNPSDLDSPEETDRARLIKLKDNAKDMYNLIYFSHELLNGLPSARQVNDLIIRLENMINKIEGSETK